MELLELFYPIKLKRLLTANKFLERNSFEFSLEDVDSIAQHDLPTQRRRCSDMELFFIAEITAVVLEFAHLEFLSLGAVFHEVSLILSNSKLWNSFVFIEVISSPEPMFWISRGSALLKVLPQNRFLCDLFESSVTLILLESCNLPNSVISRLLSFLSQNRINLVISQKVISPQIKHALKKARVSFLSGVSNRYLSAVEYLSTAKMTSVQSILDLSIKSAHTYLGRLDHFELKSVLNEQYVFLYAADESNRKPSKCVHTLIVTLNSQQPSLHFIEAVRFACKILAQSVLQSTPQISSPWRV
jgi:hypothetical protein